MAIFARRDRSYPALVADAHGGHRLGLLNPETQLLDLEASTEEEPIYYTPALTETQKYLWELYLKGIAETMKLAGSNDVPVWFNGDVTNGNKHPSGILGTRDVSDQVTIAYYNTLPMAPVQERQGYALCRRDRCAQLGPGSDRDPAGRDAPARVSQRGYPACESSQADSGRSAVGCIAPWAGSTGSREWLFGNVARLLSPLSYVGGLESRQITRKAVRSRTLPLLGARDDTRQLWRPVWLI